MGVAGSACRAPGLLCLLTQPLVIDYRCTNIKFITAGLDTCAKNAVKLRLQLAEYCILKCTIKAQLPALLPLLTKQVNRQCNGRLTCLRLLMLVAAWICKCHNSSRRCVPPAKALNLLCYTGAG